MSGKGLVGKSGTHLSLTYLLAVPSIDLKS
jgi:hypothetical protein